MDDFLSYIDTVIAVCFLNLVNCYNIGTVNVQESEKVYAVIVLPISYIMFAYICLIIFVKDVCACLIFNRMFVLL